MNGWGLLDGQPVLAAWEFPPVEYRRRVESARKRMAAAEIDCLFLTSEKNVRYLTGFHEQSWVSPARPRYFIVPLVGEPIAIVATKTVPIVQATSWITEFHSWPAPRPADDGVSLVVDALRAHVKRGGRVAAELGPETRMEIPVGDFLRIREALDGITFADAGSVLRPLRMVKSAAEVDYIRRAARTGSEAFARLPGLLAQGQTERDVYRKLHLLLIELGADKVSYLVPISGPNGIGQINLGPTDRTLVPGDLLYVDVGATCRGYYCDFNRNFAITRATDELRATYARLVEATQAGIAAVRPGRTAADVWGAMAGIVNPRGRSDSPVGRMGHGLGLDITEPPSFASGDETVLEEGMVLTIEPSMVLPPEGGMDWRIMVHEEDIVVTRDGCEVLTQPAPPALPVV